MSSRFLAIMLAFALLVGAGEANALDQIGVNFADGLQLAPADVAGYVPHANWNNAVAIHNTPDSGVIPAGTVTDSTGAVVLGSSVAWATSPAWFGWTPTSPPCTPGDVILHDYNFIGTPTTPITVTVTNIPYAQYEVATFMHCNHVDRGLEVTVVETGITYIGQPPSAVPFDGNYVQATSTNPALPTLGATFSLHQGLSSPTLDIIMLPKTTGTWQDQGFSAGFQIIEVPEPITLALLGMGSVALLRRRRT